MEETDLYLQEAERLEGERAGDRDWREDWGALYNPPKFTKRVIAARNRYAADPKPTRPHRAGRSEWAATKNVFSTFPCQVCGGTSSELHHILSRDGDGTWPRGDDYRSNLAPLCAPCHRLITERDMDTRSRLRQHFTRSQLDYLRRRIGERVDAYLARHYPEPA